MKWLERFSAGRDHGKKKEDVEERERMLRRIRSVEHRVTALEVIARERLIARERMRRGIPHA